MNSTQAKKIPIEDFLFSLGFSFKTQKGKDLWYLSPLRTEKTPSFKVNTGLNTWYDFGLGRGGSIIDLACVMFNEGVAGALREIEGACSNQAPLSFNMPETKRTEPEKREKALKLESVTEITEPKLIEYLESRGLNLDLAARYLKQVYFVYNNQVTRQYALALKNNAGDYDFRNPLMKGFLGDIKTITTINVKKGHKVAVFEGMFDFLSFMSDFGIEQMESTVLILNSTALKQEALMFLKDNHFEKAYFFLDNDDPGRETLAFLSSSLPYPWSDKSAIYAGFNDYSEFYQKKVKAC